MSAQAAPPPTETEPLFADVIVPRHLAGPFTYTVPSSLRHTLRIGHRVLVPFGRSILEGAVVAISHVIPQGLDRVRLKEIRSLISEGTATDVSSSLFQLSRQVAEAYVAPWGQCLRLVLPPISKPLAPVVHFELTEQGRAALESRAPCSVKERALLTRLRNKPLKLRQSSRRPASADLMGDLKARGWVVEVQDIPATSAAPLSLTTRREKRGSLDSTAPLISDPAMSWAEPLFDAMKGPGAMQVLVQASWADRLRLLQQATRFVLDRGQTILLIVGEAERAEWVAGYSVMTRRAFPLSVSIAAFQTS